MRAVGRNHFLGEATINRLSLKYNERQREASFIIANSGDLKTPPNHQDSFLF